PEKPPPREEDLHLISCLLGLAAPAGRPGAPGPGELASGYLDLPANGSQLAAVCACLGTELRFVWGPPGTGKTETLGLLAAEAFLRGETVLVVAHSNAAVDAAAIALVRNLARSDPGRQNLAKGEALRVGDPFLQEAQELPVTERAVLQRRRPELVARLERLEGRGGELMDNQASLFGEPARALRSRSAREPGQELGKVTEDLRKVREQIGRAEKELLGDAQLVLTTLSRAAITPEIHERRFDRVLIDEASMAQPPQVVLAASLATRGPGAAMAIFGDFRQLGPVVQSWARPVKQWLGRDVFELNGLVRSVDTTPLLSVLDIQYRMHPKIMGLVNGPSYGGRLKPGPAVLSAGSALAKSAPCPGEPVAWIDIGEFGARGFPTHTHSRLNPMSAWLALQVALTMLGSGTAEVGIVTPYRDQARLLRLLVRAAGVAERVHTGTIHRFQGGERDAIILDLVDSAPLSPGMLFRSDDGLRLLNVAITRARGKLVCLSDSSYLKRGTAGQSPVWAILANLCREAAPIEPSSVIDARQTDAGWAVMKPSTDTATLFEHDLAQSGEIVAFESGVPAWAASVLRERRDGIRRVAAGSRVVLADSLAWLFPKQEPWSLRLSDAQVVKLLAQTIATPPTPPATSYPPQERPSAPTGAYPPAGDVPRASGRPAGDAPRASGRPAAGETSLGTCRACGAELGLASSPSGLRLACAACNTFERDAEPIDLTVSARAQGIRCGCGQEVRGRRGPTGLFLGCASYPKCRQTRQARSLLAR
ncbi:MAG: AAA domain-containing protein, partial [Actinomycetota bacterium]